MIKKLFPVLAIFSLLLVILSSGCMNQAAQCPVVVSQIDGLAIQGLRTSYNEIPVGDQVTLEAVVQNMGNAVAKNINVSLWSHSGFSILSSSPWQFVSSMSPPNLDICSAGDVKIFNWTLRAGCDPKETTLAISVDYDYNSSGWASIFLVSSKEAEEAGGQFNEKGQNFPSAGPIQVIIEPLQTEPVILSTNANTFDVRVKFKNLGNGLAGPVGNGKLNQIVLTVGGPCKFEQGQDGYISPTKLIWDSSHGGEVSLGSKSQDALKVAHLEVPVDYFSQGFIKDFCTIHADANYHYRIVEATAQKMGITGSAQQIQDCRHTYPIFCCYEGISNYWSDAQCTGLATQSNPNNCEQTTGQSCQSKCVSEGGTTGNIVSGVCMCKTQ